MDAGVDGFRLDVFGWIMKDAALRSNPIRPHVASDGPHLFQRIYTQNTAENVQLAKGLRAVTAAYEPERMLVGESSVVPTPCVPLG
uniref:CAZy families GH13 protein n=1 Tax=uncultured Leptospira sp. TaxID=253437 RepID=A0A060C1N7_9LEPT|nr:CAZy families GH13 protein [uncultured Leptospira sp.]